MCAQFTLKEYANDLSVKFGIEISEPIDELRVRGFLKTEKAPVVIIENNKPTVKWMCFSLCPRWSKEFPAPFTSYNARMERVKTSANQEKKIERIYEIPSWRAPFTKGQTCLVPMNAAIESSYFGSHGGQMIQFWKKDESIYYAVGIWESWVDKSTGEIHETFALITDDPYQFFFDSGHDRSVFIIDEKNHEKWLQDKKMTGSQRFDFLRESRITLDWKVEVDREMAKGWEKRAPSKKEISEITVWKN